MLHLERLQHELRGRVRLAALEQGRLHQRVLPRGVPREDARGVDVAGARAGGRSERPPPPGRLSRPPTWFGSRSRDSRGILVLGAKQHTENATFLLFGQLTPPPK